MLIQAFFIILLALVPFFGLGPVLFADGARTERILTAVIVFVIFGVLIYLYQKALHYVKNK